MREIDVNLITETVAQLCIDANIYLNDDIKNALIENAKKKKTK
ncbi:hypothetical protein OFR27_06240 [Brachyspira hyodysenteriae]|nr:hypothetical protein [Brachyspira hyodysenteriae]MDA0034721.1 hypothetical protein [Brachyspira hyodysenteriae]